MATTNDRLQAVLDAAQRLLAAREDGMVTIAEWEALQAAVECCRSPGSEKALPHSDGHGGE